MAIVEAASCGLQVVTTRVGGIPEVLPNSLTILTEPTIESVYAGLRLAVQRQLRKRALTSNEHISPSSNGVDIKLRNRSSNNPSKKNNKNKPKTSLNALPSANGLCPFECNEIVRNLYNWENVAERTENVYRHVLLQSDPPIGEKLRLYGAACGSFMVVIASLYWWLRILDWLFPRNLIDEAREYPRPTQTFQRKPTQSSQRRRPSQYR